MIVDLIYDVFLLESVCVWYAQLSQEKNGLNFVTLG